VKNAPFRLAKCEIAVNSHRPQPLSPCFLHHAARPAADVEHTFHAMSADEILENGEVKMGAAIVPPEVAG